MENEEQNAIDWHPIREVIDAFLLDAKSRHPVGSKEYRLLSVFKCGYMKWGDAPTTKQLKWAKDLMEKLGDGRFVLVDTWRAGARVSQHGSPA